MISDVVFEKIITRKFEGSAVTKFWLGTAGLITLALAGVVAILFSPYLLIVGLVVIGLSIWLFKKLKNSTRVEYEYCFVNGSLTVDKIVNMEKRTRQLEIEVKSVERIGDYSDDMDMKNINYILNYASTDAKENSIYMTYRDAEGKTACLVIEKDEAMLDGMKRYISPSVYREGFKKYGR